MYDELIERLRETSIDFGESDHVSVMLIEAANAIEELEKENEKLHDDLGKAIRKLTETRWIPVTERLPEKDDDVLMYAEWTGMSGTIYKDISLSTISELKNMGYRVTHWMPIPEPPKEET